MLKQEGFSLDIRGMFLIMKTDRQLGQGGAKCPEAVQPPASEVFKAKLDNTIYQCRKHSKIEMDFKTNEAIKTATFGLNLI